MPYRCEAASVEGFVQHLACNLVNKGYWFYVTGRIPERKEPAAVDRKLIDLYALELSKWARARRKAHGKANVAYIRRGRVFVLLATQGQHQLFERETYVQDVRRTPIQFCGYSIGCSKGSDGRYHASVKIQADVYDALECRFLELGLHRTMESLVDELRGIRFVPYARVRRQLLKLVSRINDVRRAAGFEPVPFSALNLRRQIVKVFKEDAASCGDDGVFQGASTSNIVEDQETVVK